MASEPNAFGIEIVIGKLKRHEYQVLIKFQQKGFKQAVEEYNLRSILLLIQFRIRKNCFNRGRS
jgi:hypothetical protein